VLCCAASSAELVEVNVGGAVLGRGPFIRGVTSDGRFARSPQDHGRRVGSPPWRAVGCADVFSSGFAVTIVIAVAVFVAAVRSLSSCDGYAWVGGGPKSG
jgi:hypothetical protein